MSAAPPHLNYEQNTYLTVTLSSTSPYLNEPSLLSNAHPLLAYGGQVGEMKDVQLISVPTAEWSKDGIREDVFTKLLGKDGVGNVQVVQAPKMRNKRSEF